MNEQSHGDSVAFNEAVISEVKPELLVLTENQAARFWPKVKKSTEPNGCWIWIGALSVDGYGHFNLAGRRGIRCEKIVPRISWQIHRGPIPEGMCVCHNCPGGDNPSCLNPLHLWLGTHHQNMLDREAKGRGNQVRGDAHHSKIKDGHMAYGDRNGSRTHPESRPRGEGHWMGKLNEEKIREIRRLHNETDMTNEQIGRMFGISGGMVGHIYSRRAWKHVI